jgi:antitoxin YefM
VVLLAAEEFAAMEETLHLLSTPANAERIREGLADYQAGKLQTGELCD